MNVKIRLRKLHRMALKYEESSFKCVAIRPSRPQAKLNRYLGVVLHVICMSFTSDHSPAYLRRSMVVTRHFELPAPLCILRVINEPQLNKLPVLRKEQHLHGPILVTLTLTLTFLGRERISSTKRSSLGSTIETKTHLFSSKIAYVQLFLFTTSKNRIQDQALGIHPLSLVSVISEDKCGSIRKAPFLPLPPPPPL